MKPGIDQKLFTAYADFHRPYVAMLNRALAPYGLYSAQWAVLRRLYYLEEPINIAVLARRHAVETPTMTNWIKKLVQLAYVDVERGEDRRERKAALSEKGRVIAEEILGRIAIVQETILGDASKQDKKAVIAMFEMMKKNLGRIGDAEPLV